MRLKGVFAIVIILVLFPASVLFAELLPHEEAFKRCMIDAIAVGLEECGGPGGYAVDTDGDGILDACTNIRGAQDTCRTYSQRN